MNCPMCDSSFTGQAGMEMAGLVSWQCMDCRFLWWMTPVPLSGREAATDRLAEASAVLVSTQPESGPETLLEAA